METKKITNWFNWREWKSVIDDAYNEEQNINLYKRAFSTIVAWETREANMPPVVACLKEILSAKLSKIDRQDASVDQTYVYQSSLSMSIVRFVNVITEPYQDHIFAKPIKAIANKIGLPDWIVNLRHNATHFSMPSVEILENAIDFLYQWLKERYVNTFKEIPLEQSVLQNVKLYIHNLLVDYMNTRYKKVLMKKKDKKLIDASLDQNIEMLTLNFRNETFETLLEDGYLIPTKDHLNAIGIVAEEFIEQDNIEVPKSFLNIWMDYLLFCNNNNLLNLFFQKLLQTYRLENDLAFSSNMVTLRNKFILSWIYTLIKLNSYKNEKSKNAKFRFEFNFKEVLLDIFKGSPNSLNLIFLKESSKIISFQNHINSTQFEKLYALISLMDEANQDQVVSNIDDSNQNEADQKVYDFQIFEKYSNTSNKATHTNNTLYFKKTNNLRTDWKSIDDCNWNYENLKLGLIEDQSYNDLNLDIKQFSAKNERDNNMDNSFLNESGQIGAKNSNSVSIFAAEKFGNIETLKKSLLSNYWETS